jgi:hypothetical protein
MIGLQNAGKTSLLKVLAVSSWPTYYFTKSIANVVYEQGGEFTVEYVPQSRELPL